MKIFVAQINPTVGAINLNTLKVLDYMERAKEVGAEIILFPELTLCGYPPEDLLCHRSFIEAMESQLSRIAKASSHLTVIVGLARRVTRKGEKHLYNSAAVIEGGNVSGFQDKWLLPTYDVFDEKRYFEPGLTTGVWKIGGKRVGITLCEDIWQHAGYIEQTRYERDPILALASFQPDILVNLSASPYCFEKPDMRINVCKKAARTLRCPVLLACQVGANEQIIFDGYSLYVNHVGDLCRIGEGFSEEGFLVDTEKEHPPLPFHYDPMHNLLSALTLGVKDYCRKCAFETACLGLSGGIDSALVAYVAVKALGQEYVSGIGMPSRYTSADSRRDAELFAGTLGIRFTEVEIESLFRTSLEVLAPSFQGKEPDTTEENIQSRIRGMLLMAFSNKYGHIVLSTGNKSEMAMGFTTLYGDMCGGLGVIGDVVKTRVYALCRYINRMEKREVIPESIIRRPPSAELREGQLDSDDLPEYGMIDRVLEGYVEDYLSIDETAEKYNIPKESVVDLVKRIHASEYKRKQAPPILRVSKKSFGIGRRYPVVQGWL
ncbi:MAG: NAD+ synthase [Simkaniaceae bacterium]|nr:NAD+ synthase [Simkaniaceae bacterium]